MRISDWSSDVCSSDLAYARAVGVTTPALRAALFTDAAKRPLGGHRAEERYVATMRDAPARDPPDRAQYADIKLSLPGAILHKNARTRMAVRLAARDPLRAPGHLGFVAT